MRVVPRFAKGEISDVYVRDNFEKLEEYLVKDVLGKFRFRFISQSFPNAGTRFKIKHRLTFKPLDIIMLSVSDSDGVAVTWHYDEFTTTELVVTVSGACTFRFLVGRYED